MINNLSRYFCAILFFLCAVIFCSCHSESALHENETENNVSYIKPYSKIPENSISIKFIKNTQSKDTPDEIFTRIIQHSTTAVVAEYIEDNSLENSYRKFKNIEVIYGYAPDEYIYVPVSETFKSDGNYYKLPSGEFTDGEKYLLIAHYYNHFFNPYPEYQLSQDMFIPLDDPDNNFIGNFKIELSNNANASDLVSYVKYIAETKGYDIYETLYTPNIFRGESLKTVVKNCDYLLEVTVKEKESGDKYASSNIFKCSVNRVLRGNISGFDKDNFMINVKADTLKEGESYIIALYNHGNIDKVLEQASDNGIVALSDFWKVFEVYLCLWLIP